MGKANKERKSSYGIAEWYGRVFRTLSQNERLELVEKPKGAACPFMLARPDLAPRGKTVCNKDGGVCSIRSFTPDNAGNVSFGPITASCPNRFLDKGTIFSEIGRVLLGTDSPAIVKEIPFLIRSRVVEGDETAEGNDPDNEDVGRIDMVMLNPDLPYLHWCAVEVQAVYFSGGAMSKDYAIIQEHRSDSIPLPGANRRPDFRSCGPKRLMPQLQTKVPTLRRWGKKMAVVVDRPFFDAMGPMDRVSDLSNADIAWFIVRFDEPSQGQQAKLVVDEVRFTTLERAVEGLTAGIPTSLGDFENKIRAKGKIKAS